MTDGEFKETDKYFVTCDNKNKVPQTSNNANNFIDLRNNIVNMVFPGQVTVNQDPYIFDIFFMF